LTTMRLTTRTLLVVGCFFLCIAVGHAQVAINPRPPGFSVYQFLVDNSQYLTDYWRQMRFQKMAITPFSFYRGAASLFWRDWLGNPALSPFGSEKTVVWVQGDLHIENYGSFQDDGGHIVYEVNDFDEGCPNQYQGDLWRLATSIVLVCQEAGLEGPDTAHVVRAAAKGYRKAVDHFVSGAINPNKVDFDVDDTDGPLKDFLEEITDSESRKKMLDKWAPKNSKGDRAFNLSSIDFLPIEPVLAAQIRGNIPFYMTTLDNKLGDDPSFFVVKDLAQRVNAGTGSLGVARYYMLVEGPTKDDDDDYILDIKQARQSTVFAFADAAWQAQYLIWFPSEFFRHNTAYRAISREVDNTLGAMLINIDGHRTDFYVRGVNPYKSTWEYAAYPDASTYEKMATWWGRILATQHARSDSRFSPVYVPYDFPKEFSALTSADPSAFYDHVWEVASTYATQVNTDYAAFLNCLNSGNC